MLFEFNISSPCFLIKRLNVAGQFKKNSSLRKQSHFLKFQRDPQKISNSVIKIIHWWHKWINFGKVSLIFLRSTIVLNIILTQCSCFQCFNHLFMVAIELPKRWLQFIFEAWSLRISYLYPFTKLKWSFIG